MRILSLRAVVLIAGLVLATVAHSQEKTTYDTTPVLAQIGELSMWARDQCESTGFAAPCMKEALDLIQNVHVVIKKMNDFNASPTIAKRDMIQTSAHALMVRINKWADQYHIRTLRVPTVPTK